MFSWIHNKRNGRHVSKKRNFVSSANHYTQKEPAACKQEFIDWPHGHGLLAIGTIGNTNLKKFTEKINLEENSSSSQDTSRDLTPEEEGTLEKDLDLLLTEAFGQVISSVEDQPEPSNVSLDRIVKQLSDDAVVHSEEYSCNKDGEHVQMSTSVVYNNRGNAISKKTMSFLLKKMFACRSGFAVAPTLRDPIPESRIEKMLRAILHKKIYPQSSTSSTTLSAKKKYLENRHKPKGANGDDDNDGVENGSKWVKTDSEYIVLEI